MGWNPKELAAMAAQAQEFEKKHGEMPPTGRGPVPKQETVTISRREYEALQLARQEKYARGRLLYRVFDAVESNDIEALRVEAVRALVRHVPGHYEPRTRRGETPEVDSAELDSKLNEAVRYLDVIERTEKRVRQETLYALSVRLGSHPGSEEDVTEDSIYDHVRWLEERARQER